MVAASSCLPPHGRGVPSLTDTVSSCQGISYDKISPHFPQDLRVPPPRGLRSKAGRLSRDVGAAPWGKPQSADGWGDEKPWGDVGIIAGGIEANLEKPTFCKKKGNSFPPQSPSKPQHEPQRRRECAGPAAWSQSPARTRSAQAPAPHVLFSSLVPVPGRFHVSHSSTTPPVPPLRTSGQQSDHRGSSPPLFIAPPSPSLPLHPPPSVPSSQTPVKLLMSAD